jgi:hypothetical protein
MRSVIIARITFFSSDRAANKVALKSPSSDPSLCDPDRTGKKSPHLTAVAAPRSLPTEQGLMMAITIDSRFVTQLRQLVMGTCGELVTFIRTQPLGHTTKVKVWLCVSNAAVDLIMDAVMRSLPSAEFGRITRA